MVVCAEAHGGEGVVQGGRVVANGGISGSGESETDSDRERGAGEVGGRVKML